MVTSGDLSTNTELIFIYILTLFVLKCNTVEGELQSQERSFVQVLDVRRDIRCVGVFLG